MQSADTIESERKKLQWFMWFVLIVLIISAGTDFIFSFYGSSNIPKTRNPFMTVEYTPTPTPFTAGITLPNTTPSSNIKGCPMDAKECPNGTFVGRSGPKCEFVACPK